MIFTSSYVARATPLLMSVSLSRLVGDDAHIRNGVAFLQRRQRAHEHDDAALRRQDVLKRTIQVVGHGPDLRALDDVRVAIDGWMEDPLAVRRHGDNLADPDG